MELLDASAGRMVSGGEMMADGYWDWIQGGGGGGGGDGGAWESGWGAWDTPSAPGEGHLEFDNKLADAVGLTAGSATTAFVGGFLEGAALGSEMGPGALLAGIVVGGFAAVAAKRALAHH